MAIAAPARVLDGALTGFAAQEGLNALESPSSAADAITGDICPAATVNPRINLQNRQDAIETGHFGPLDPYLPNSAYWQDAAAEWNASAEFVKHARCGNCAAFNITTAMRECISAGSQSLDAWLAVEAGPLGYCEIFDFRCAAKRRCNMWVAGGPLTDDLAQQFTGYDYELEEYKSEAALLKHNPNHDSAGRFSTGGGSVSSAAARAGKLAKDLSSKLGNKSGPPHGFAEDGARRKDDTSDEEESAHYDYIMTLPMATQEAIDNYVQHSQDINDLLRTHPQIFERARDLHANGEFDIEAAANISVQAAGMKRGTPEFAEAFALTKDAVRIDKAIEGAPPMKERIVLRGLQGTNTTLDVISARADSDGVIKLKGVASSTTDPSVANRFTLGDASADKPFVMEIRTKRGLLVEGVSMQGEQEVLLRPNGSYKILGTGTGRYSSVDAAKEVPTLQLELLGS